MRLIALTLAAAASLAAATALAARPTQCSTGSGARGYDQGYRLESRVVEHIWSTRFTCETIDDFVQAVNVGFNPSHTADRYLKCRNMGLGDAIVDKMEEKQNYCAAECYNAGEAIGELQGKLYCGERLFTQGASLCTLTSTQGCTSALRSYVASACPDRAAADPGYDNYVEQSCKL